MDTKEDGNATHPSEESYGGSYYDNLPRRPDDDGPPPLAFTPNVETHPTSRLPSSYDNLDQRIHPAIETTSSDQDLTSALESDGLMTSCDHSSSLEPDSTAALDDHQPTTVKCQWSECQKALTVVSGKVKVHTCPTCYSYYCSRQCRNRHREAHKCPYTRVSNLCQEVLQKIRQDSSSRRHLSICAQRGLLSRGRGVVRLAFLNPQGAMDYLTLGWDAVRGQMFYVPRSELMPHDMGPHVYSQVRTLCDKYDPEKKFVLLVAICVTQEIMTSTGVSGISRDMVVKAMKLRLSKPLPEDDVQTLILPVVPPPGGVNGEVPPYNQRIHGLHQIEAQLENRGVFLSKQYPDVYLKVRAFVDQGEAFSPICVFPTDTRTGRIFMCIVLPWADEELLAKISSKTTQSKARRRWIF